MSKEEEWVRLLGWMKEQGEVVEQPGFKKCSIGVHLLVRMKGLWPGLPFSVEKSEKHGWLHVSISGRSDLVPWKQHRKSAVEKVFGGLCENKHGLGLTYG